MANSAVITAKIGPAVTLTAKTFNNVKNFWFDLEKATLTIYYLESNTVKVVVLDVAASTTFTLVLTAGNYVLTVS